MPPQVLYAQAHAAVRRQVSRILGHASTTITLDVYTHLFDDARHARELCERMAEGSFARLLAG